MANMQQYGLKRGSTACFPAAQSFFFALYSLVSVTLANPSCLHAVSPPQGLCPRSSTVIINSVAYAIDATLPSSVYDD